MTYRSNPFDKQDYSKFAFKKSELLAVIQAIDENFSFDLVNADLQENKELLHIEANTNVNLNRALSKISFLVYLYS